MHKRLDCFHVAFSDGKDSVVLLDLVKHALPKASFIVVFGDTHMKFPDTYKVVDVVEKQCKAFGSKAPTEQASHGFSGRSAQ